MFMIKINKLHSKSGEILDTIEFKNEHGVRYEHTALSGFKLLGKGYLMLAGLMFALGMGTKLVELCH